MKTKILSLIAAASILGCTTVQVIDPPLIVESTGTTPTIGATETVAVGSVMFSQYRLWKKTGMHIPTGYRGKVGGAEVEVLSSDYLVKAVADSQEAYCTQRMTMKNLLGVPTKPTCFTGPAGETFFTKVIVPSDAIWWSRDLPEPIRFIKTEAYIPRQESLRRELIYLGTAGKVIRLAYREYLGDMARPAFAQEVSYDLGKLPFEILFKSARFEVLDVGSSSLRYRVLNPLDSH
ncbi:hypothetical protein M5C97_01725 [Acidovorax sp. NCPPB 3859]|nr:MULTISPECIES: hypothetical protein [unclassified Acidovorax]MDA8449900.1 hypothetical protein [Acidovorax sp. GBBC 3297]MDA8459345.1 hypothetical protein [Acidovorax sp. GBBC 3333]MDA8464382.1 hypothetical protein [Acidovorax sp. GBBC 3332]MDA8469407.1 hypothetical protein [Acidovorax sp. GBBC 3299]WCM79042.1 hypothetical protein M5C94_01725 [Acidovorax sp. GBBC 712]